MTKKVWVVAKQGFGQGVYYPMRYYFSEVEAAKDVVAAGTDGEHSPCRKMWPIKVLEKYQPSLDKH